jgi:hypothetical protein
MEQRKLKTCSSCKTEKQLDSFGKNKRQADRHHYYCKACVKKASEEKKQKNKEYYKRWVEENKEQVKAYQKKYKKDNRDKINEYQRSLPLEKKRKANCSEKKKQRGKHRRQDKVHKDKRRVYYIQKYQEDIQYKLKKLLEAQLRTLFEMDDITIKSKDLIGCTIPEFKAYLQSIWLPTMSWNNYATEWQIDRIKPYCEFDLTDPRQKQECMCFQNTQPLFSTTRVIDGVEYIGNLNKNRFTL